MPRTPTAGLLLVLLLLVPAILAAPRVPAAADAGEAPALAVEDEPGDVDEDAPPPGPEPRLGEDSPFGPPEYDVPWTYGMGVLLSAVAVLAIVGVAGAYWLLVRRPERESSEG